MLNYQQKRAARVEIFEDTLRWIRTEPTLRQATEQSTTNTILLDENAAPSQTAFVGRPNITVTRERTQELSLIHI